MVKDMSTMGNKWNTKIIVLFALIFLATLCLAKVDIRNSTKVPSQESACENSKSKHETKTSLGKDEIRQPNWNMSILISLLSLSVAGLAVFVGPMISSKSSKRAMLGPMRQKWINDFRLLLAEFSSATLHYYVSGFNDKNDSEYKNLMEIKYKIIYMINPNEKEHQELVVLLDEITNHLNSGENGWSFVDNHQKLTSCGQALLKKEWNVIKSQ